jgi:folylpolyglutamate synthase/dihydropteroate synthase
MPDFASTARIFMAFEEYGRMVYQDEFGLADLPLPQPAGRHQYANAAAAIRAVKAAGFRCHRLAPSKRR